ncbi:MAG: pseudouridine synthase [Bacilli bacterium]|nr:pseudouridine synthase [Bacilli bacterium]
MDRLQKVIADAGITSRRKAELLIIKGKVMVNGNIVTELGTKVDSSDDIVVDGMKLSKEEKEYYLFNKPRGVVTTTADDKGRKTVMDYFDSTKRLYPIGRLDYNTTGLLIVTNDGDFANLMMHPSNEIDKVYIAKLTGLIDGFAIKKLKDGVLVDGVRVSAPRVKLRKKDFKTKTSIVEIVIHEGKNHQVKKMFEAVGFLVDKLKRESIGFLNLKGLDSGEYRRLTPKEIQQLYALANKKTK